MCPDDQTTHRFIRFFNNCQAIIGHSVRQLHEDATTGDSVSTISRVLNLRAPLTVGRAKRLTRVFAHDLGHSWFDLWSYLSADKIDAHREFTEFELGTFWASDPRRVVGLAHLMGICRRREPRLLWYSENVPFPLLPVEHLAPCTRRGAQTLNAAACHVSKAEVRLNRLLHQQMFEQTAALVQNTLVPIFRDNFERLIDRRPPFDQLSEADVREIIESLVEDWVWDRKVLPVLISKSLCPPVLHRHFTRFRNVWLTGDRLLIRHFHRWTGWLLYQKSTDAAANGHIELEMSRLNQLLLWREHDLDQASVAKELERYLR